MNQTTQAELALYRYYGERLQVQTPPTTQPSGATILQLMDQFDHFFLDGFGTLYHYDHPIAGAPEMLNTLRQRGKSIRILTNAASRPASKLGSFLRSIGIPVADEEIIASGSLLPKALSQMEKSYRKVFHLGHPQAEELLIQSGLTLFTPEELQQELIHPTSPPLVIITSRLDRYAEQVDLAHQYLKLPEARLVVLNPDAMAPLPDGSKIPVSGLQAWELYQDTQCDFQILGKPFPELFIAALESLPSGATVERTLMIGDTPGTDMQGARHQGITCTLRLGGNVHTLNWREICHYLNIQPHFYLAPNSWEIFL